MIHYALVGELKDVVHMILLRMGSDNTSVIASHVNHFSPVLPEGQSITPIQALDFMVCYNV